MPGKSRDELIEMVRRLQGGRFSSEDEVSDLLSELEDNVPDPEVSDYIFGPKATDMSAEEVVDKALSYRPILL